MFIYFLMPLVALFSNLHSYERLKFVLFVVFFGFFCGARGGGVDLDYYNYLYLWFRNYNFIELTIEPVPKIIFNIFFSSGLEFNYALIFFAVLTLFIIYISCRTYKVNTAVYFISYSGYFLLIQNMMQVRMSLALALIFYGCVCFSVKNAKRGCIFFVLGIFSHQATLLFVLFFMIMFRASYSYKLLYYLFISALVFQVQSIFGFDYFGLFFGHVVKFIDIPKMYFYYDSYISNTNNVNVYNILHLINLMLLCISFYIIVTKKIQDKLILFFTNMISIGIILFNVFYRLPSFSFRISEMMFFFLPFILAYCYGVLNIKNRIALVVLIYILANISIYKVVWDSSTINEYVSFI